MSATTYILPTRGSTPTDADRKLVADLRRMLPTYERAQAFTLDEAAALVAAHRCRAEESVWHEASKALAASA